MSQPTPHQQPVTSGPLQFAVRVGLAFIVMVLLPIGIGKLFLRSPMPNVAAWIQSPDATTDIRVYDPSQNQVSTLPLNTYMLEVLSAECSPDAPLASLEAAAVATRTYAQRAIASPAPLARKYGADVTDDPSLDLPLVTEDELESAIGTSRALACITRIQTAIEMTAGRILTFNQQPILAFMCAISTGRTRTGLAAFGQAIPYLQAVACPDDEASPSETATNTFSIPALNQALGTNLSSTRSFQLQRGADGFVTAVHVGSKTMTGQSFANLLQLPSSDFVWHLAPDAVSITTYGRGSDLGMSLHEASALAAKGWTWQAILSHFYPGAKLSQASGDIGYHLEEKGK
ncbi:stage II sporulation protein D [Alicyclobacillus sacchari]|uniref:Stage II sporulation protein D n=1 Tax=Alicyclobacillus sacchari TaxID=392010 RepID=A0A4R8LTM5_9BACL|nr:SpoIID/LytB domain-containing protein [Alicyclobacillus sacchari]TDY50087.1 stage II sporulation protein D [Alicyclobacillus sacchari]GMA57564.1 stage II sporulation protein D [Alicyclobacillus sacchari]